MTTSATYSLDFEVSELCDEAFERVGIDPATLTMRHARSARRSFNLLFSYWATKGVRLFSVDEQTQTVTNATASYTPATGTLAILEGVIRRSSVDTPVHHIGREQYHLIPNKTNAGLPSQVFYDRKANLYYLWNVPENSTDVFRYYRLRRIQDVTTAQQTFDVPYHWFEALASGAAEFLSVKFAPDRYTGLKAMAADRLANALTENRERVDTSVSLV